MLDTQPSNVLTLGRLADIDFVMCPMWGCGDCLFWVIRDSTTDPCDPSSYQVCSGASCLLNNDDMAWSWASVLTWQTLAYPFKSILNPGEIVWASDPGVFGPLKGFWPRVSLVIRTPWRFMTQCVSVAFALGSFLNHSPESPVMDSELLWVRTIRETRIPCFRPLDAPFSLPLIYSKFKNLITTGGHFYSSLLCTLSTIPLLCV